jgi:hypothetical protein
MGKHTGHQRALVGRGDTQHQRGTNDMPSPTMQFRRRAWLEFQRALDPLAPPKRLPMKRPR